MSGMEVIDFYSDDSIRATNNKRFPLPAVVRCPKYVKHKRNTVAFSRKNVFIRDQLTCQYCGTRGLVRELTYDHIIPRSVWRQEAYNGTPTNWTNIVTCCLSCNKKKADRTPKQAGMTLLRSAITPNVSQFILGLSPWMHIPDEWLPYLTPVYKHLLEKGKS